MNGQNPEPDQGPSTVIRGSDIAYAWEAIKSENPDLLPSPDLAVAGDVEEPSEHPGAIQYVIKGAAVELRGKPVYVHHREDTSSEEDQRLIVKPEAQPALRQGLENFTQGPDRADYIHLRLGKVLSAIRRKRAARRILPRLTERS